MTVASCCLRSEAMSRGLPSDELSCICQVSEMSRYTLKKFLSPAAKRRRTTASGTAWPP